MDGSPSAATPRARRSALWLVVKHELRHILRSGIGIVAVVITLNGFLLVGDLAVRGFRMFHHAAGGLPHSKQGYVEAVENLASFAVGADPAHVHYLLDVRPALVSAIYVVATFALPFLVCFVVYNQTASAIERKSLRFQLLRAPRASILFGRFLAWALFAEALVGVSIAILAAYVALNVKLYAPAETIQYFAHVEGALALVVLPYAALACWVSAALAAPRLALFVVQAIAAGVPVLAAIAGHYAGALHAIGYLTPWPLLFDLVHPSAATEIGAVVAMLAYTGAYLAGAWRTFAARDL